MELLNTRFMERRDFIKTTLFSSFAMNSLSSLSAWASEAETTALMPVLFVGHGSPMNAIEANEFSRTWQQIGQKIPTPKAILCVSAHWETKGTKVTAMPEPRTIHDFGGFPKALFDAQYPAAGSPALAAETIKTIQMAQVQSDSEWGLDHGCWSVLLPMFPKANIPVVQLSLDYTQKPEYHYALATQLQKLRSKGVLILGSGNIVHNLGMLDWNKNSGFDWAEKFNQHIKQAIVNHDHAAIIKYTQWGKEANLAVPTPEHFLPLLYTLALQQKNEKVAFFNDKSMMGSISMTSVQIG